VRKPLLIPLAFGFIFALVSGTSGQGVNYTANPNPELQNNGLAMPGSNSNPKGQSGTSNNATTDEDDPSLQRLSSKDTLGPAMLRDDGQLTAKMRRREKISKVESTKQLPTTGIDPKFQGSLLHSSVSSIEDVGEKAPVHTNANASTDVAADTGPKFENDPRFGGKRFVFTPATADESKKKEAPRSQTDSSPSPSPSPSASVSPSSH
jgi:hypothetical protein